MLTVRTTASPFEVHIEGDITGASDLTVKFKDLAVPASGPIRVDCRQVRYINSVGVKQWVLLFGAYRQAGRKLTFHGCSPMIVSQLSLIPNFIRLEEIVTMQLPFICDGCQREQVGEYAVSELRVAGEVKIPSATCTSCGSRLTFDENPTEYLHFLE